MKFSGVLFLAIAVAARLPARWPAHLLVRGGADTLDDLEAAASPTLGDLDFRVGATFVSVSSLTLTQIHSKALRGVILFACIMKTIRYAQVFSLIRSR